MVDKRSSLKRSVKTVPDALPVTEVLVEPPERWEWRELVLETTDADGDMGDWGDLRGIKMEEEGDELGRAAGAGYTL